MAGSNAPRDTVEGADKKTGQDRVIQIEADTKAQAERLATERGLLVSDVHQPVNLSPEEQVETLVAGLAEPDRVEMSRKLQASRRNVNPPSPTPSYVGLQFGAVAFNIVGGLWFVLGAVAIILAVYGAARYGIEIATPFLVLYAIGSAMTACIFIALAAGCDAMRDMARNSFTK